VSSSLTLEGIAKLAGVSRSTVSRVVNDHPNVRAPVRERVWQVIRETGYQPHAAARSLVTRRTRIVGVIIPEALTTLFTDPFFPHLLCGITQTCNSHGYQLMLSLFNGPAGPAEMYRRVVGGGHLDGVVVASSRLGDPLVGRLLDDGLPFVMVGRHPDERVRYVDIDNVAAARMAVDHLARLGHRRIGIISGPLDMLPGGADRLEGYRQAMAAHRLPVDDGWIVEGDYTEESGMAAARRLLSLPVTAIFAANDNMAVGALKLIREVNLQVPEDVALVGFDDLPIAASLQPALTTVRQPIEQMGSMAADLLLSLLDNPPEGRPPAHKLVLPTKLVVRESCGALR
jgi:LacI family transcriptional regulator